MSERLPSRPISDDDSPRILIGSISEDQLFVTFKPPIPAGMLYDVLIDELNVQDIEPTDFFRAGGISTIYYNASVKDFSEQEVVAEYVRRYREIAKALPIRRELYGPKDWLAQAAVKKSVD